jgi:hypothetical protein
MSLSAGQPVGFRHGHFLQLASTLPSAKLRKKQFADNGIIRALAQGVGVLIDAGVESVG